jgi:hypothetical protein
MDPTAGARRLLGVDNVWARRVHDTLLVGMCSVVKCKKLHIDSKYGGKCYTAVPCALHSSKVMYWYGGNNEIMDNGNKIECSRQGTRYFELMDTTGRWMAYTWCWTNHYCGDQTWATRTSN